MINRKKLLAGVLAALMVSTVLAGCGQKDKTVEKAPLVKTQQADGSNAAEDSVYAGTVCGRYETNMSFQVGGQILSRNVQVGSQVHAGDVLMTIDARDVVQQANQGDQQVASANAQLKLAQSNLSRYTQLYEAQAVPASVLDQYQTSYDAAFAAYQIALTQAARGHNAMGYTQLTAGADGVISAVNAETGQVVAAGQTVLTLVQTGELEIEINIPENRLSDAVVGNSVKVSFWALNDTVDGVIREVAPMADSTARTYRVRVSVPNPPAAMQLGMTASVSLVHGDAAASAGGMILPLSAIYQTGDKPQVWVVTDDHTVTLKTVSVEEFGDDKVRVHGLDPADQVVIAGVHKLRDGQQVRTEDSQ